jgi:nucleotide-binding universal stress UspA family protein
MNNIKKILVPIDFSETAKNALKYVSELVKTSQDIEVTLLHITAMVSSVESKDAAGQQLADLSRQFGDLIPNCISRVESGDLVGTIISVHKDQSSDLIIMGTHGSMDEEKETNTSRLVLEADCPVLVIPDNQKEFNLKNIALALGSNTIDNSGGLQALHDFAITIEATVHVLTVNRNGEGPSVKEENQEVLEYYLESLLYFYAFPKNTDIELGISDYIEEHNIDMLAILPRNHTRTTKPSEGRLTKLLTMHTKVPLLTID